MMREVTVTIRYDPDVDAATFRSTLAGQSS
jgi:hypothetical protein